MIAIAHALFAAVLALVFRLNPFITIIFSLIPDAEFILPTFHRGPLHSLIFVLPLSVAAYFYDKNTGKSVLAGLASHLFLDSLTVMGVPLLYPFVNKYFSLHFFDTNQLTFLVIILCAVILFNKTRVQPIRVVGAFFLVMLLFCSVPVLGSSKLIFSYSCPEEFTELSEVSLHAGEYVLVEGIICSEVKDYTSNAGNEYQDFQLCNDSEVRVFKQKSVQENLFKRGDCLRICAKYTEKYGGELYYVKSVEII